VITHELLTWESDRILEWIIMGRSAAGKAFQEAIDFPLLPASYEEIVPQLYAADEFGLVLPLADRLVNNFWKLIENQSIRVNNYQFVEEIVL
jgi:hypothetical protein